MIFPLPHSRPSEAKSGEAVNDVVSSSVSVSHCSALDWAELSLAGGRPVGLNSKLCHKVFVAPQPCSICIYSPSAD